MSHVLLQAKSLSLFFFFKGFFDEISSPLLSDIKISYTGNTVDESTVTRTNYNLYFNGSEIFVTGKLRVPTITGITTTVQMNSL